MVEKSTEMCSAPLQMSGLHQASQSVSDDSRSFVFHGHNAAGEASGPETREHWLTISSGFQAM